MALLAQVAVVAAAQAAIFKLAAGQMKFGMMAQRAVMSVLLVKERVALASAAQEVYPLRKTMALVALDLACHTTHVSGRGELASVAEGLTGPSVFFGAQGVASRQQM